MLDLETEWSISFAGCGFMGIYYVGATSCILERCPRLIQDASKIYGASAGALMAAILSIGIPLESCCADLMFMAKEGRKHKLGPLHPAYNLLQLVKDSLARSLPEDAHVRASGKLCVSLTRVSDGRNVLVSEFDSREELTQLEEMEEECVGAVMAASLLEQNRRSDSAESSRAMLHVLQHLSSKFIITTDALVCSCFVPFYCGVVPPTYRGVHYVDGAVSDNLPRSQQKNTVTFSPYAGESDLCPQANNALNFGEVRFNNMSIQVNLENVCRVTSTFFPPPLETMAETCQKGYIDALRFLQENNLISSECPMRSLETDAPRPACCELVKEAAETKECNEETQQSGLKPSQEQHGWLDPQLIEKLPLHIKKVLCEACRETHGSGGLLSHVTGYLPKNITSYLQIPRFLPMDSACSLAQRVVDWIPDVPRDMSWLYGMAGDMYKKAWRGEVDDYERETQLRKCVSLPSGLNLWDQRKEEDMNTLPPTPEATPTSSLTFTWNTGSEMDPLSLTPPPTPTFSPPFGFDGGATDSPKSAGRNWGLGRAVGWIRNIGSEQSSNHKKKDDSVSFSAFK